MSMPIPIILLTGFLGAGKTTLINDLLRSPKFANTAVLVNELGEIALDHDLIANADGDLVSSTTGCMCCTASGDVRQAFLDLWRKRQRGDIPEFSRVVVETTGLVDPAPVVAELVAGLGSAEAQSENASPFVLSSVVTLFDTLLGDGALESYREAREQVALADHIVLTKTDLSDDPATLADIERSVSALAELNPGARIYDRQKSFGAVKGALLSPAPHDGYVPKTSHDRPSLERHTFTPLNGPRETFHLHSHDRIRHRDGIESHCIIIDEPLSPGSFEHFLDDLRSGFGAGLLRMKGLFCLSDDPERPVIAHSVRHVVHRHDRLDNWPSDDRRTRFVLIGENLEIASVAASLKTSSITLQE